MFNQRVIFASISLLLVLGLIFEWNSNSKNTKLQESVVVQNSTNLAGYEKIKTVDPIKERTKSLRSLPEVIRKTLKGRGAGENSV